MRSLSCRRTLFCLSLVLSAVLVLPAVVRAEDEVRVSVVAILATNAPKGRIDPEVADIAREAQKKYPDLTSFHLARMTCDSVALGKEDSFKLVDGQEVSITVQPAADRNGRWRVQVKPPQLGPISYTTCCGKYFPIVTPYVTKKNQEQLIIAIMVTHEK